MYENDLGFSSDKLKKLCKEKGVSVSELGRLSGTDRVRASAWTNGRHEPNVVSLVRLADALGVPLDDLVIRAKDQAARAASAA